MDETKRKLTEAEEERLETFQKLVWDLERDGWTRIRRFGQRSKDGSRMLQPGGSKRTASPGASARNWRSLRIPSAVQPTAGSPITGQRNRERKRYTLTRHPAAADICTATLKKTDALSSAGKPHLWRYPRSWRNCKGWI